MSNAFAAVANTWQTVANAWQTVGRHLADRWQTNFSNEKRVDPRSKGVSNMRMVHVKRQGGLSSAVLGRNPLFESS
jgi:hypothetical protein